MGESRAGTIHPQPQPAGPLHWGPLTPSAPLPVPPVKRMTKDLSYAGSKNQIFLLAFSFVACRAPPSPHPHPHPRPGPGLEAVPPLKLFFKTKVYSVCWWQDPLLPSPQGPGVLPSPPLLLPPPKEKGEGRIVPPPLGCFLGALQTPA